MRNHDLRVAHVAVDVASDDQMGRMTSLAIGGLIVAAVLALMGGLPFDLPMPTHAIGWVEPSCGLTRGSTAIARGDFGLAWRYNPLSFAAMGFGLAGVARAAVGLATGRWLTIDVQVGAIGWLLAVATVVALWLYQQSHAEFVMHARL